MNTEETKKAIATIISNLNEDQLNKIINYLNYILLISDSN